ncbi:soluble starch synthase 1, chloroplastic/amyloplastic-like [Glycine soja]|uniref:soluble starch synthase 1, chloroplastic/amyloplastic-like n=1 Tax=Glycine soja TaxID=3848 RepID=UPI0010389F22|nr:soluble starch synthase 1, chloroplastic/amyloplastic-like [Glycine soja]
MFAQKKVTLSLGRHKIVILDEADSNLGLPPEWYRALGWVFPTWARTHSLDTGEAVNFLKGVVVIADRIVTAKCKISLQKELGLPVRPDYPMVMLGLGNSIYEDWMSATKSAYKDKFRGWVGFNVPISHKITARLNQLYAMRYGTIPVVHETGGLRDTVHNLNPYTEESKAESTGYVVHEL